MSLYLPEQKLGSHSSEDGSSNKFILKGRQTGTIHRGHTWVFRAETHDTMMAWYEDIKALTEKTAEERSQFVRSHSRSLSRSSRRSVSSDGLVDEDDEEPFSASSQIDLNPNPKQDAMARRSQPGGRFPSDIQVNAQRGLQAPHSPSSMSSGPKELHSDGQAAVVSGAMPAGGAAAGVSADSQDHDNGYGGGEKAGMNETHSGAALANSEALRDGVNPYTSEPVKAQDDDDGGVWVGSVAEHGDQAAKDGAAQRPGSGDETGIADDVEDSQHAGGTDVGAMAVSRGGVSQDESSEQKQSQDAPAQQTKAEVAAAAAGPSLNQRPAASTIRGESATTITNLYMPGGYPRGSTGAGNS